MTINFSDIEAPSKAKPKKIKPVIVTTGDEPVTITLSDWAMFRFGMYAGCGGFTILFVLTIIFTGISLILEAIISAL